jgi:Spy/CpxP family protein refolding chaperone
MSARVSNRILAAVLSMAVGLGAASLLAQGGGMSMGMASMKRLDRLTATLKLDDAGKKQAKKILDDAFKAAAPLRTSLAAARQKLGAAVQAGDQAQIEQATAAYAEQATSMAAAEAKAVAAIVHGLTPEQATAAAVQTTVSLMRGAFVGKKWDTAPDLRFY